MMTRHKVNIVKHFFFRVSVYTKKNKFVCYSTCTIFVEHTYATTYDNTLLDTFPTTYIVSRYIITQQVEQSTQYSYNSINMCVCSAGTAMYISKKDTSLATLPCTATVSYGIDVYFLVVCNTCM